MIRVRAVVLGGLVFLLYFFTLSPGVYLEDSGEFITSVHTLGLAHPSGYPLFLILAKLFSFLPVGEIAFRINLFSVVFGVLSTVVLYFILEHVAKVLDLKSRISSLYAFLFALAFGISRDFWSQAIVAEVYTLNTFLVGLLVLMLLGWLESREQKKLYYLAFLSGLGLANHLLFLFVVPVVWVLVLIKSKLRIKDYLLFSLLFLVGLSVYLYLPLRGSEDFLNHIFRTDYQDTGFALREGFKFFVGFWQSMSLNLHLFVIIAALGGLVILWRRRKSSLFYLLLIGFLSSSILPIFLRNLEYSSVAEYVYRVYFFQAYIFVLVLAFILFIHFPAKWKQVFVVFVFLSVTLTTFQNYNLVDLSSSQVGQYYEEQLSKLDPNSRYLLIGKDYDYESQLFVLNYLQKVKNQRLDVEIVDGRQGLDLDSNKLSEIRSVYLENFGDGPIHASFPIIAYDISKQQLFEQIPDIDLENLARVSWDLAYQDFLASHYYKKARTLLARGDAQGAGEAFVRAVKFDNQVDSEDSRAFREFRKMLTN